MSGDRRLIIRYQHREKAHHVLAESKTEEFVLPSDRSVGLLFAGFFLLVALLPVAFGRPLVWWALVASSVFAAIAILCPRVLAPLNRWWMKLGLLLHKLVSPVALGVIFFGAIMPTGIVFRLLRKDPLRLRIDPGGKSYWIERQDGGKREDFMKDQF